MQIATSNRYPVFLVGTLFALSLVTLFGGSPAWAKTADITLVPTRIVLENNTRYATVNVKNSGDGIGRYRIELIDATMQPDGSVKLREDGSRDPFSALDLLSISPRSMTINPGDFQTVRLLVKNPASLANGEYRSHLKVKLTETDIDADTNQPKPDAASITLKPKLVMVLPVIIRHGETNFHVTIDDAKLGMSDGNSPQPQLHMTFGFEGTRSVIGDIKVTHTGKDGKITLLRFFPGIAIYRGTPKRDLTIPLEVPQGLNIREGTISVSYLTQDKEGASVMAQKDVTP